jgi:hypothetical protein
LPAEVVERVVAHGVFWYDSDADGLRGSKPYGATVRLLAGSPDLLRGEKFGAFAPVGEPAPSRGRKTTRSDGTDADVALAAARADRGLPVKVPAGAEA